MIQSLEGFHTFTLKDKITDGKYYLFVIKPNIVRGIILVEDFAYSYFRNGKATAKASLVFNHPSYSLPNRDVLFLFTAGNEDFLFKEIPKDLLELEAILYNLEDII